MLVTISNRYGCGAIAVAARIAQQLGYALVDEQLPVVVAKKLKTSTQAVESAVEGAKSISERVLRALESGTPELRPAPGPSFDESVMREVQAAVRECAARGNAVIVGRGANAILGARQDVLRVFMHAPRDWRIEHVAQAYGIDRRTAATEVDRIDRARTEYMRTYFDMSWSDAQNYDLCIDTSVFGEGGSAALLVAAVRARSR
jgi:cytidylate kinase